MAEADAGDDDTGNGPVQGGVRWRRVAAGGAVAIALGLGVAWTAREPLVGSYVSGQLESLGLPAKYRIVRIGAGEQVLEGVVIGDPARPDLTVDRVIVRTGLRGGLPGITGVTLVRPRLWARWDGKRFSLGSLDKLLQGPSTGPRGLPALDLRIEGGEALVAMPRGHLALRFAGAGGLDDGFAGVLGASWPGARLGPCAAGKAVFSGPIAVREGKPAFAGPLQFDRLDCGTAAAGPVRIDLAARIEQGLDAVGGNLAISASDVRAGGVRVRGLGGAARVSLKGNGLVGNYRLALAGVASPQALAARLGIEGAARGDLGDGGLFAEGEVTGSGLAPGAATAAAMRAGVRATAGTLLAPLLAEAGTALDREARGSRIAGRYTVRRQGGNFSVVLPKATVTGGSGATLLALSRIGVRQEAGGPWLVDGNVLTGGRGLPAINGRMTRDGAGRPLLRFAMAEYRAGGASLAVPTLAVTSRRAGSFGFAGEIVASGALPGGFAQGLRVPVAGDWSAAGLAIGRACSTLRFSALQVAELRLGQESLTLCPPTGGAIIENGRRGLRVAAGVTRLDLAGRLGATPLRVISGPVGFAWPGTMHARALDIALGSGEGLSRFRLADLDAKLGKDVGGSFKGVDVALAAVPIDLRDAAGRWRYAGGRLELAEASFRASDRAQVPRFKPLVARGATLALADNRITAEALLREPESDRAVVKVALRHDLGSGNGRADLAVDDVRFDSALQPDMLTPLALGVVANVEGKVRGRGEVAWRGGTVTSGGSFHSDGLDLAAALGPVKGVSGTVTFTDLIGFVTAPRQQLRIASMNPGIAVDDGVLTFALEPGQIVAVEGGEWPFLDGRLTLLPTRLGFGAADVRRFTLRVQGISAARFVERMEISNLAATGQFDGELPLAFDQDGGRIEGGRLESRAPGGNVSYVGELSYKDLSPMANFAFRTLRDLDYRRMTIGMDGSLAGELVTRVSMSGVTQGKGATKNFITRQLGRLPLRFDVNIRAPFLKLVSSFRSLYDSRYVPDPRELELIDAEGRPIAGRDSAKAPQTVIQRSESEHRP